MKKVTTPSRKEVQGTTTVVIITVFLFAAYFWVIDTIIRRRSIRRCEACHIGKCGGDEAVLMADEEIKPETNSVEEQPSSEIGYRRRCCGNAEESEYEVVHHPHLFGL